MQDLSELKLAGNVVFGQDGHLFLASDRHFTMDVLTGQKKTTERSLRNFKENLNRREVLSRRAGARYLHLVAPDKHVALRQHFPLSDFVVLGEQYRDHATPNFLYPVEELRAVGGGYSRTDTHWNVRGQIAIAGLLARSFELEPAEVAAAEAVLQRQIRPGTRPTAGDLGVKLTPPQTELMESYRVPWKIHSFSNEMQSGNDGRIRITFSESPHARGRLLIFGDSFIAQTQNALTAFFKEIVFCRTRFFHHEMVVATRPDYVLSENVERYLFAVGTDAEAPPMLLMAQLSGHQVSFTEQNLAAFGAIMAPRSRHYKDFVGKLYGAEAVAEPA
ncbi:hypothetical protein BKE38_10855 [Pseudoroseomonas deserti]|uniref:AlgX/AlgJ SGNH hydrolase-like domain-containing protein n=1 Tax=Teichococcus deserti TaxID=1817963 RepID=A0A1V2H2S1_9PROT|nr:hypothetical protein [Pseudoroseomonas deserti]ONG54056.1 hypothetical protein BKE38_10855 [Pseudoroseomonas deserti]